MEPPPDAESAHERESDPGLEPDPKRQRVGEGVGGGAQEDDAFRGLQEQCKRLEAVLAQVTGAAEEERTRSRAQIEVLRLEVLCLRRQLPAHKSTAVAKEMLKEASDMAAVAGEKEVPPVLGVPAPPVPGQDSDAANVGNGEHVSGESSRNSSAASEEDSTMAEKSEDGALDQRRSPVASAPQPPNRVDEDDDVSSPSLQPLLVELNCCLLIRGGRVLGSR